MRLETYKQQMKRLAYNPLSLGSSMLARVQVLQIIVRCQCCSRLRPCLGTMLNLSSCWHSLWTPSVACTPEPAEEKLERCRLLLLFLRV